MYEFDIKQMLAAFDNDAEKLANEFANQLNKELSIRRQEREIQNAAAEVADAWNDLVETYFDIHEVPVGHQIEDYKVFDEGKCWIQLLETYVKYNPDLDKCIAALNSFSKVADKAVQSINTNMKKLKEEVKNTEITKEFDTAMSEFFDKMGW